MKKITLYFTLLSMFCASLGSAQSKDKTIVASKGDGVFSILRDNGLDPTIYHKEFISMNKSNLSQKNGLYIGRTYRLPINKDSLINTLENIPKDSPAPESGTSSTTLENIFEPLFGPSNENVVLNDNALKGATYYLVSGHGGPDPGAVAKYQNKIISEDEYAYDVTLRLGKKLMSHGAKVYIIIKDPNDGIRDARVLDIDHDEVNYDDKTIARRQKRRLQQRAIIINDLFKKNKGYQRLVVTHVDSRSSGKNIDVFFYHHKLSTKGKRLALNIQNTFKEKYARFQPNRKYTGTVVTRSSLYMVKNTLPAMVYIELGNIRNKKDQKRILEYGNRDAMAKWIAEGLIKDFEEN